MACYCVLTWGGDRGGLLLCVNMGGGDRGGLLLCVNMGKIGVACYLWTLLLR